MPLVSVLMSVYDNASTLHAALDSILAQTLTDFEFIVIDDASPDNSKIIIHEYTDSRFVLIENEGNLGLTAALNVGLRSAKGKYVARMDADDIALPTRLEKQITYLEQHPEVGILGTAAEVIGAEGESQGIARRPQADLAIRWMSLLANPFLHPTVMFRWELLVEHSLSYDERFSTAQDYDLWCRLLEHTQGANLAEPLLQYRLSHGITGEHRQSQLRNHDIIAAESIARILPGFSIASDRVSALRALTAGHAAFEDDPDPQRIVLLNDYLNLFTVFAAKHHHHPDLGKLKQHVAWEVADLALRRPLRPGWSGILMRLVRIAPGFSLRLPLALARAGYRRLRGRA
ncbi:MAG: glycosyltransferase [Anaerolineales bacterium]|nr:glycosyltransferase [Anaerolineales bacterium]